MRLLPWRGRCLALLGTLALAVPVLSGTALQATASAATRAPLPPIVPQPVSETAVAGPGFTINARTPIDVVSHDATLATKCRKWSQIATLTPPGRDVPSATTGAPRAGRPR